MSSKEATRLPDAPRLLRTADAAAYCGMAKSTLEKLRCYGGGPVFTRRGKKAVFYNVQDLADWLASLPRFHSTSDAYPGREAA